MCDQQLQPGIFSIETRDAQQQNNGGDGNNGGSRGVVGYKNYGNANQYGNITGVA